MYELEVCEHIDRSHSGKGDPSTFHVELRFLEKEDASALMLSGPSHAMRALAELDLKAIPFTPTKRDEAGRCVPRTLDDLYNREYFRVK